MKITSQELYQKLIEDEKITTVQGKMSFSLGSVNMVVKQHDVVGNIMQEWLKNWMFEKGIEFAENDNLQMPPDFYLNPDDKTENLLEVKAFYCGRGPGFDIAGFTPFLKELINKPYVLNTDYLIFSYDVDGNGNVIIKDLWLKKIWNITRRSKNFALNFQVKANVIHKIRPGIWYRGDFNSQKYKEFECPEDFISAVNYAALNDSATQQLSNGWIGRFVNSYKDHYGVRLNIPQWQEIQEKYDLSDQHEYNKTVKVIEKLTHRKANESEKLEKNNDKLNKMNTDTKTRQQLESTISKRERCIEEYNRQLTVLTEKVNALKVKLDRWN